MTLARYTDFVNEQIDFHERQAAKFERKSDERSVKLHQQFARKFRELSQALLAADEVIQRQESISGPPDTQPAPDAGLALLLESPLHLTAATLAGLPDDLIRELNISPTDRFEWTVVELVNRAPSRQMSLEVLLVALWHRTQQVNTRTALANKLYRMMRKGMLFSVPARKGVYTTARPENYVDGVTDPLEAPDASE